MTETSGSRAAVRLAAIAALAGVLILLVVPIDARLRFDVFWGPLGDRLHTAIFAAVVLALAALAGERRALLTAVVGALALAGASELVQAWVGRSPSWQDVGHDIVGIALGSGIILVARGRRPAGVLLLVGAIAVALVASRDLPDAYRTRNALLERLPVIYDFESPPGVERWSPFFGATIDDRPEPSRGDRHDGVLGFRAAGSGSFPGVATTTLPVDWSGYASLQVTGRGRMADADSVVLGLRLEDADFLEDGGYFVQQFAFGADRTSCDVPFDSLTPRQVSRAFDASRVITLKFYAVQPVDSVFVEIDHVELR
ncbi:hypothetical protein GF314_07340 [bacterium]|nr:hypothetical protein [bacterium]